MIMTNKKEYILNLQNFEKQRLSSAVTILQGIMNSVMTPDTMSMSYKIDDECVYIKLDPEQVKEFIKMLISFAGSEEITIHTCDIAKEEK